MREFSLGPPFRKPSIVDPQRFENLVATKTEAVVERASYAKAHAGRRSPLVPDQYKRGWNRSCRHLGETDVRIALLPLTVSFNVCVQGGTEKLEHNVRKTALDRLRTEGHPSFLGAIIEISLNDLTGRKV
jgi:hypothetical protein